MYNEITKTHNFEHIYKFHTKSILDVYEDLTNYLLDKSLDSLLEEKNSNSNCIGHPSYYLSLDQDMYNNKLKQQYNSFVTVSKEFVRGTIFYSDKSTFDKVVYFIKNGNYRSFFLNNLYENNSINPDYSPIHFLERLFGVIN